MTVHVPVKQTATAAAIPSPPSTMISAARSTTRRILLHPKRPPHPSITSSRSLSIPATDETPKPQTFSQNEFPDRDEPPIITKSHASTPSKPKQSTSFPYTIPPSRRITPTPPPSIPPNIPQSSLSIPTTQLTTLPNGVRVGSIETYSQVSTLGVVLNYGSRYESESTKDPLTNTTVSTAGVNHLMELLAFQSTQSYQSTQIQSILESLGGACFATSSREQFLYGVDVLRPNAERAFELLAETVVRPMVYEEEVEGMKQVVEFQLEDLDMKVLLGEGLQMAGYGVVDGGVQQLGRPHFCTIDNLQKLTPQSVHTFRSLHLLQNPQSIVVAGTGIEHSSLVNLASSTFGHIQPSPTPLNPHKPSIYTGGEYRQSTPPNPNPSLKKEEFTHVALAFEVGGWHSADLVPVCVLQTLLGGGESFSAGGPGKGMYSRLYREVLNRYRWAESTQAFSSFHVESGMFGIQGSSKPEKSGELTRVLVDNFIKLAEEEVSDEELDRARNMLKCNVLTQLESRLILFEDIGRQILTYGEREDEVSMCKKIDGVTKEDIRKIVKRALEKPVTVATVGVDVGNVPRREEIVRWFEQGKRRKSWF